MTITTAPAEGIQGAGQPAVPHTPAHTPRPIAQITQAGPGRITWRIYDAAADYQVQTHRALAAGHVDYPVDADQTQINSAHGRADREASEALAEVLRLLARR